MSSARTSELRSALCLSQPLKTRRHDPSTHDHPRCPRRIGTRAGTSTAIAGGAADLTEGEIRALPTSRIKDYPQEGRACPGGVLVGALAGRPEDGSGCVLAVARLVQRAEAQMRKCDQAIPRLENRHPARAHRDLLGNSKTVDVTRTRRSPRNRRSSRSPLTRRASASRSTRTSWATRKWRQDHSAEPHGTPIRSRYAPRPRYWFARRRTGPTRISTVS